jgi:hypothetical protein
MAGNKLRRSFSMRVRRALEAIILTVSLVFGLAIVGTCGTSGGETSLSPGGLAGGAFVALILVGAVFLFTSMSRDVRLLRERLTDEAVAEAPSAQQQAPTDTHVQA